MCDPWCIAGLLVECEGLSIIRMTRSCLLDKGTRGFNAGEQGSCRLRSSDIQPVHSWSSKSSTEEPGAAVSGSGKPLAPSQSPLTSLDNALPKTHDNANRRPSRQGKSKSVCPTAAANRLFWTGRPSTTWTEWVRREIEKRLQPWWRHLCVKPALPHDALGYFMKCSSSVALINTCRSSGLIICDPALGWSCDGSY